MSLRETTAPQRGMGSIAHFFLSESTVNRQENDLQANQKDITSDPEGANFGQVAVGSAEQTKEKSLHTELLLGEVILADHLSEADERVRAYVEYLRRLEEKVGVVQIDASEAYLLEGEEQEGHQRKVIAETEDIEGALIPALNELAGHYDVLLVNLEASFRRRAKELIENCTWVTVISTCQEGERIETYKNLKWLAEEVGWEGKIYLFVCEVPGDSEDEAEEKSLRVFDKLTDTAQKFLKVQVELTGYQLQKKAPVKKATLAEAEHKIRAEVTQEKESKNSLEEKQSVGQERSNRLTIFRPMPIASLPRNDDELKDILQLALPGWPGVFSAPVMVPIPREKDIVERILIDSTGRAYVTDASLQGDEKLSVRALTRRKWLEDNLSLIAGYCRQVRIDQDLIPGVVLAGAGSLEALKITCSAISDFPCHLLQLYFLQTGEDFSLLSVPR